MRSFASFWANTLHPALALFLLAGYAVLMWCLDRWSLGVAFDAYISWQRVAANAALGLVAVVLLASLTRRLLGSILLVAGLQGLLYVASAIKFGLLGVPVVWQDVYFLKALDASSLDLLSSYVDASPLFVGAAVLAIILLLVLFGLEKPWCRAMGPARGVSVLLGLGMIATLYVATWPWNTSWYDKGHVRPLRELSRESQDLRRLRHSMVPLEANEAAPWASTACSSNPAFR